MVGHGSFRHHLVEKWTRVVFFELYWHVVFGRKPASVPAAAGIPEIQGVGMFALRGLFGHMHRTGAMSDRPEPCQPARFRSYALTGNVS